MLKKAYKHFLTVTKHKYYVFRLSIKAGIPVRGFLHDFSKYSFTEFWESAKYYTDGKSSPITNCKRERGYSKAWLHHKGKNKHHHEYWYDYETTDEVPVIPYKYTVESSSTAGSFPRSGPKRNTVKKEGHREKRILRLPEIEVNPWRGKKP